MRSFLCSVGETLVVEQPHGRTTVTVLSSDTGVMRLRIAVDGEEERELIIGSDRPVGRDAGLLTTAG